MRNFARQLDLQRFTKPRRSTVKSLHLFLGQVEHFKGTWTRWRRFTSCPSGLFIAALLTNGALRCRVGTRGERERESESQRCSICMSDNVLLALWAPWLPVTVSWVLRESSKTCTRRRRNGIKKTYWVVNKYCNAAFSPCWCKDSCTGFWIQGCSGPVNFLNP